MGSEMCIRDSRCYRDTVLPKETRFWYKGDDGLWWLEKKNGASTTEDGVSLAQILDDPGPFKLPLFPARYTTSAGAARGSWCLQVHVSSAFSRGVQRNVDDSRGAAVISSLLRRRRAQQFSGFLGSPTWITSGRFCVLGFEFTPGVASGLSCVLDSALSLWVVPGAFCV